MSGTQMSVFVAYFFVASEEHAERQRVPDEEPEFKDMADLMLKTLATIEYKARQVTASRRHRRHLTPQHPVHKKRKLKKEVVESPVSLEPEVDLHELVEKAGGGERVNDISCIK